MEHATSARRRSTRCGGTSRSSASSPQGPAHVERLAEAIEDAEFPFPGAVRELGALLFVQIAEPNEKIAELEKDLRERAREDERTVRLMSVPGIGRRWAMAIQASRRRWRASVAAGTSQPGWGWFPGRARSAGSRRWGGYRRWVSATSGDGWSPARRRQLVGSRGAARSAHRLGADDEEQVLPRAAADRLRKQGPVGAVANASRSEDGKGKRSPRRGRENQRVRQCLRAHVGSVVAGEPQKQNGWSAVCGKSAQSIDHAHRQLPRTSAAHARRHGASAQGPESLVSPYPTVSPLTASRMRSQPTRNPESAKGAALFRRRAMGVSASVSARAT